jgi:hypothetical protein
LENRDITIYDGYIHHTSIIPYAPNVKRLLQRCDLIPFNCKDDFVVQGTGMCLDLCGSKITWSLRGPLCYVRQDDGHSCGPIAYLKIMSVFGRIPAHITDPNLLSPLEIRQMIVDNFRHLLDELNDEIRVNVPRRKKNIDKSVSMTNTVSDNALDGQRSKSLARITADREAAQAERTELRLLTASKMVQRSGVDVRKRSGQVGDIVSTIMDKKKEAQRRGLLGIAFAVSENGGCCIITKHGIIGHGKGYLWVPIDRYKVLCDDMPIEEELYMLRDQILKDEFIKTSQKSISLATAFRLVYETAEDVDKVMPQDAVKSKYQQAVGRCKCKCKKDVPKDAHVSRKQWDADANAKESVVTFSI